MLALILLVGLSPAQPSPTYNDIVALQNAALAASDGSSRQIQDHQRSIAIAEKLGRPRLLAVLFHRLGMALEQSGVVQKAVIAYESGLRALESDPTMNVRDELNSIAGLPKNFEAVVGSAPGDLYSEPLARDLAAAESDPLLPVMLLVGIGNAYLAQPQPDPAIGAYERALERSEIAAAPKLRAYALANLGEAQRRKGQIEEAERTLTSALAELRRHAPAVEARRAHALLAGIYRDRKLDAQSLAAYHEALALYQQAQDPRGEGRALAGLGRLHLAARRHDDAERAYRRAVELGEKADDQESLWHAYWGLGQAQYERGDLTGAAASLDESLKSIDTRRLDLATDEGKVTLLDSVQQVFDQLIRIQLRRAPGDATAHGAALAAAERARAGAMRDLMGPGGRRVLNCEPPPKIEHGPDGPPQMAMGTPSQPRIDVRQQAPSTPSRAIFDPADRMYDPRCQEGRSTATVAPPPLARLVFHVLDDATVVFGVRPDGETRAHLAPVGREALTRQVHALRAALGVDEAGRGWTTTRTSSQDDAVDPDEHLRRLYAELVAPVAGHLPPGRPVMIEPHGPLWLVPFAALRAADGAVMADRWPLLYAPSHEIVDEIRREPPFERPGDLKALIVGNPTAPTLGVEDDERFRGEVVRARFEPLPGAEEEARTIARLLPDANRTVLVGPAAHLRAIETQSRQHTMVHLASHALAFPESPLDSFVMLAASPGTDGRLTARRVLDLSLRADLVTLSACQTGLGQLSGDGVIGLSRAFLVRGARSVLVSQWSVSDTATAELMSAFYREYTRGTADKARALQLAMQRVRAQPRFAHPRYWASFALIGSER